MPFTFACPHCAETGSHEQVIVEHAASAHPGAPRVRPVGVFRTQAEAQLGYAPRLDIACRRCARPTSHDGSLWRHEDGSEACVQPG